MLLLIEALRTDDGPRWTYGLARSGHAAMHVRFDGEDVWEEPQAGRTDPTEAYWLFSAPVDPDESSWSDFGVRVAGWA